MDEKKREELLKKIEEYSKKIEKNPNVASNYYNRGNTFSILKEYEKAIDDYSRAIELNPNDDASYNNRGISFNRLKEYEKAINDYNKAIELNPNYSLAYNNRGNTFSILKEYEKAIDDYNKAIELNPNDDDAYYNRGNTFSILKEYEKAIENYEKAIELDPNNNSAKKIKNLILKLKRNKNIQHSNKIVDTTKNIEEINKEENLESNIIHDSSDSLTSNLSKNFQEAFSNALDLHLSEKFEEAEKEFSDFINKYKDSPNKSPALDNQLTEAALYLIASKTKVKRLKGYLIFADILGWKGIWKKFSLTEEKFGVVNRLLTIRIKLENEIKKQNSICSMNLISDTFIIYSKTFEMTFKLSKKLIELCLENNLVIRGAISYGECYNKDTVYVGPAVDEAASWHDVGEEIGIFYTPSARLSIQNNIDFKNFHLLKGYIKLKSGKLETFFINWYDEEKNKDNFYNIMKNEIITPDISSKYFNTEKKLNKDIKDNIEEKEEC